MPFNYLLTNLVADVPGAVGAVFLDGEGEAVEWVTRHEEPFDFKVEGAYHSVFVRRLGRPLQDEGFGALQAFELVGERLVSLTRVLADGYHLVLVLGRNGPRSRARWELERTAAVFARELE